MGDPLAGVNIDFNRVRSNAEQVRTLTGVPVLAVIKSDAYGLGARGVAEAISGVVDGFCVFSLEEAQRINLRDSGGKPILAIGPPDEVDAADYIAAGVHPNVWTVEQARRLAAAQPALNVDTGMQRFSCPPENVQEVLAVGGISQAFTHAVRPEQAAQLVELVGARGKIPLHAAGSSLLADPSCRLDAVRPGLALYRGAVRISTALVDVRESRGPVGYRAFQCDRHGIILRGYRSGLRPGPCLINGRKSRILEVGMQSAYVEAAPGDKIGDEVVLLGDGLEADEIGRAWSASPQEVLVSLLKPITSRN
jgi:alanine racemase